MSKPRQGARLERTAATSMERSMIFKRMDRGLTPEQIAGRTGIPLHIVKNTIANQHKFKRRKHLSADLREKVMRLEDDLWQLSAENPFLLIDVRTDRLMERIGVALRGKMKPSDVERMLTRGRNYLSKFDDTLRYF